MAEMPSHPEPLVHGNARTRCSQRSWERPAVRSPVQRRCVIRNPVATACYTVQRRVRSAERDALGERGCSRSEGTEPSLLNSRLGDNDRLVSVARGEKGQGRGRPPTGSTVQRAADDTVEVTVHRRALRPLFLDMRVSGERFSRTLCLENRSATPEQELETEHDGREPARNSPARS